MSRTVLITGATGFIGKHLVEALFRSADESTNLVCLSRRIVRNSDSRLTWITESQLSEYAHQCDVVFHLGADARFAGTAKEHEASVRFTEVLINALTSGQRRPFFVFVSSIAAMDRHPADRLRSPLSPDSLPHPRSWYGKSKLRCEEIVRRSGLPFVIVRLTWVYGPGMRQDSHVQRFITWSQINKKRLLFRIAFPGKVSLIHVTDVVSLLTSLGPERSGDVIIAATEVVPFGGVLQAIWTAVHGVRIRQLNVSRLISQGIGRIHSLLPLQLAALFTDYWAAIPQTAQARLLEALPELIRSNSQASGTVVITGANGGIGRALVEGAIGRGWNVLALDQSFGASDTVERRVQIDLRKIADVVTIIAEVPGRLRGIIHNAGTGYKGSVAELSEAEIDDMIDIHCRVPMKITRALMTRLISDQSFIVNVVSSVAYNPLPGMSVYAATKACLLSWSLALAEELRNTNVVVTASPSGTATGFQKRARVSENGSSLLSPEYVAEEILRSVENRASHVIIGIRGKLLIEASRFLPFTVRAWLWGRLFAKVR